MDIPGFPSWGRLGIYTAIVIGAFAALRWFIIPILRRVARTTTTSWDDLLADSKFVHRLSWIIPLVLGVLFVPVLGVSGEVEEWLRKIGGILIVVAGLAALGAFIRVVEAFYRAHNAERSIKGYLQIVLIVAWVVGALVVVALLSDTSIASLLAGLAALSAVVLLVFQSTILSVVASVLLTSNDMVRLGDWITLPGTDVDGDVIDIALHTVKVRNFDKTVSTVPTTTLVEKSFINWRGVDEAGGRRIKRHLLIDLASVRFLTDEEVDRWSRFAPLADYMAAKRTELAGQGAGDGGVEPDLRRLTNLGTFRAYADAYLRAHPSLETDDFTAMVRQLQPTADGIPLEVYAFTATTEWAAYEAIQADVFDHLIARLGEFGLRVAQHPTGGDVAALGALDR